MPKRVPRLVQTEDTRRRLLEAARRVFVKRGWAGTSLEMIVREAGLTKGAVYSRFRSKADLFLALLEERIERRIAEMTAAADTAHDTLELGTTLGRQWDERLATDEAWLRLAIEFRLHAVRVPSVHRRYAALHARLRGAMADLVEREAREAGATLPIPAEDIARAALALGQGGVLERAVEGDAFPPHLNEIMNRAIVLGLEAAVAASPARPARRASR
jgi:AcrR family transcriptional regulator